jgi:Protein of unknown function DUF262
MRTTATNRKIRVLLTGISQGTLIPRPEFQRRLVWSSKHKNAFLETVLLGYPFPEIYIAAGEVDPNTGEGAEMLVDGQQRIMTLYQYFTGAEDLNLTKNIRPYSQLTDEEKRRFLAYEVVVRDLGELALEQIKEVFRRINLTNYALNAMEIQNARFDGPFKQFGEELAQDPFFEKHRVFRTNEIRRMSDVRFVLIFVITIMSTYFNRDSELDDYLERYNEDFEDEDNLRHQAREVFQFVDGCGFSQDSRVWKKADLLTLLVEAHRAIIKERLPLDPRDVGKHLQVFYAAVDAAAIGSEDGDDAAAYHKAAIQASNDRSSRITRGETIRRILHSAVKDVVSH